MLLTNAEQRMHYDSLTVCEWIQNLRFDGQEHTSNTKYRQKRERFISSSVFLCHVVFRKIKTMLWNVRLVRIEFILLICERCCVCVRYIQPSILLVIVRYGLRIGVADVRLCAVFARHSTTIVLRGKCARLACIYLYPIDILIGCEA